VVFEASSQALHQKRIDPLRPNMGIFTSFGHDHMDYHGSIAHYFQEKWALFSAKILGSGHALLCTTIPRISEKGSSLSHLKVIYYGHKSLSIPYEINTTFDVIDTQATHQDVLFSIDHHVWQSRIHLIGTFQVENILAALSAFYYAGGNLEKVIPNIHHIYGAPGRLQSISRGNKKVYIDYAHTPNALEKVLSTLRPYTRNRLIVLFGCGGNRDTSKRQQMGRIAHGNADHVIITDDNPRHEDPQSIRQDIQQGCPLGESIACRKKAIFHAISTLKAGDILLVAGRGHESAQDIQGQKISLSDHDIVTEALAL